MSREDGHIIDVCYLHGVRGCCTIRIFMYRREVIAPLADVVDHQLVDE
jgi:hypothetical protein